MPGTGGRRTAVKGGPRAVTASPSASFFAHASKS